MLELAPGAVGAIKVLVESLAKLSLVVFGDVRLRVELLYAMGEGAAVFESAEAGQLPVLAQLCLILGSEALSLGLRNIIRCISGLLWIIEVLFFTTYLVHIV
jgi:hypothetical protein